MSATAATKPGNITSMKSSKKFKRPATKFWTSGVTRRTIAFVIATPLLLIAGWAYAWNQDLVETFIEVNGGMWGFTLTVLAIVGAVTIITLLIFTPPWLEKRNKAYKALIVLAVLVALIFGNAILAAFTSGWPIILGVLGIVAVIVLLWALVAHDSLGWLRNKSTR